MPSLFQFFDLDQLSFWIGFVTGLLFYVLAIRTWPIMRQVGSFAKHKFFDLRDSLTSGSSERLRLDTYRHAQRQHLAAMLCSLDEILIAPRILTPPPIVDPGQEHPYQEAVNQVIPYLPDIPEFSAAFHMPSHDPAELLMDGAHLALVGVPGSGKTTALASLASRIARRDPDLGHLAEKLPIYVSILDLIEYAIDGKTPFDLLYNSIIRYTSTLTQPRLAEVLRSGLRSGSLLLFIDDIDELPPDQVKQAVHLIGQIIHAHPNIQLMVAATPDNHGGLLGLGMFPVALAGWHADEKQAYLEKCSILWRELAYAHPDQSFASVPPTMLLNWLGRSPISESPLEFTLRTWAAFAGDPIGSSGIDAVKSYLRRSLAGIPNGNLAIRRLAHHMASNMLAAVPKSLANELVLQFETVTVTPEPGIPGETEEVQNGKEKQKSGSNREIISNFIQNGILIEKAGDRLVFVHPIIAGYLAAEGFSEYGEISQIFQQPTWSIRFITIKYLNSHCDLTVNISTAMQNIDEPVQRQKIEVGSWLKTTDTGMPWVTQFLQQSVRDLQDNFLPMSLRYRVLTALALSNEDGIAELFRRFLTHPHPEDRQLGCIGLGLIHDTKSIVELSHMIADPDLSVRKAACIALGALNTNAAVESLTDALLHADEATQACAAETLANNIAEGHETLREGSEFDNLLVRKAVTFGLVKIKAEWALATLQKMQVEDGQWVVRNAAEQALDRLQQPYSPIPKPFPDLMNTPWLIEYAGQSGVGISSEEAGIDMLYNAAMKGNEEQKIAAFYRILLLPHIGEDGIIALYQALFGTDTTLREVSYNVLWHINGSGQKVGQPIQFGFE